MARISNIILITINSITLLLGLAAVFASLHFRIHGGSLCQKTLQVPWLLLGLFVCLVSIMGLLGPILKANWAFVIYFVLLGIYVLGIFGLTIFGVAAMKGQAAKYGGGGFMGMGKASRWLRRDVLGYKHWDKVGSCLADFNVCKRYRFEPANYKKPHSHYTRLQSGCCKPPIYCGFKHQNGTFWEEPPSGPAEPDLDCKKWNNEPRQLCYNCDACVRGMESYIRMQWMPLAITNLCIFTLVVIIANVGYCARRNVRADDPKNVKYDDRESLQSRENLQSSIHSSVHSNDDNTSAILPANETVRSQQNV